MMLFFTGFQPARRTKIERRKIAKFPDRTAELRAIYEMVNEGERILLDTTRPVADLGDLLHPGLDDEAQARRRLFPTKPSMRGMRPPARPGPGGKLLARRRRLPADVRAETGMLRHGHMRGLSYVPLCMERDGTSVVLYNPS